MCNWRGGDAGDGPPQICQLPVNSGNVPRGGEDIPGVPRDQEDSLHGAPIVAHHLEEPDGEHQGVHAVPGQEQGSADPSLL